MGLFSGNFFFAVFFSNSVLESKRELNPLQSWNLVMKRPGFENFGFFLAFRFFFCCSSRNFLWSCSDFYSALKIFVKHFQYLSWFRIFFISDFGLKPLILKFWSEFFVGFSTKWLPSAIKYSKNFDFVAKLKNFRTKTCFNWPRLQKFCPKFKNFGRV